MNSTNKNNFEIFNLVENLNKFLADEFSVCKVLKEGERNSTNYGWWWKREKRAEEDWKNASCFFQKDWK